MASSAGKLGWTVYIIKCSDGSLYTGITNDLQARLLKHKNGTGAKYTKGRGPYTLVYMEEHPDRSSASKREASIKSLNKNDKEKLLQS